VLFVVPLAPGGGGLYGSDAEKIYLAVGLVIGACAGPLQSSSRTYLAQLAPADKLGQFFGLYALSGKVTSFLAPAAVAGVTALAASQRAGIAVILVFLGVGLALLLAAPRASAGAAP
jgi:UMF1 family MFS transporter